MTAGQAMVDPLQVKRKQLSSENSQTKALLAYGKG